ncbi:MAG TPA: UDP-3-O-(3-hydroxymyristoyl)glucosamine N-acyltransferase, partial [Limnochordales bacterium]
MRQGHSLRLAEAAAMVGGRLVGGHPDHPVTGVAPVDQAGPTDITMVLSARYGRRLGGRAVAAVLVPAGRAPSELGQQARIEVEDPRAAFDRLVEHFAPPPWLPEVGVHPTAVLGRQVELGPGVRIGARVVVGDRVRIGAGCVLFPGVVVGDDVEIGEGSVLRANAVVRERVRIGRRVVVHEGAVIGSDGFGFHTGPDGVHRRRPQAGTVVLEDDVEVGANACVDRATAGATVIGRGTKIDNLVQVAHNVQLGPGCLLAGQVGIAGST